MTDRIDTSKLGPIRVDPDAEAARAKLVRDALNLLITEAQGEEFMVLAAMDHLRTQASDVLLARLGRLLR